MGLKKAISFLICAAVLMSLFALPASAVSYTYNLKGEAQETPDAVTVYAYVDEAFAGIPYKMLPVDIAASSDGGLFVADTANNAVVILDSEYKYSGEVKTLTMPDGSVGQLKNPQGVYADSRDTLYIADKDNARVIVCDKAGNVSRVISVDAAQVYISDFTFKPLKVAADKWGNVYVLSEGVYDGLLQFDSENNFIGFVGSNEVAANIIDILWKKIATREQREQYSKTIPVEFDNLDIDPLGFVYTVTSSISNSPQSSESVRKQTAKGNNILESGELFGAVIGDIEFPLTWDKNATVKGSSAFVDVSAAQDYGFSCLDENHGRVFVYNAASELMFAFGGFGTVVGCFQRPIAITSFDDKIMVLDGQTGCITVFRFTDYGNRILAAQQMYIDGDYDASSQMWTQVLGENSNLIIAYSGLAKSCIMQGEYQKAMEYAKIGGDQTTYSKAFEYYRQEMLNKNFGWILLGAAVIAAAAYVLIRLYKKTRLCEAISGNTVVKGIKYGGYIMTHPFKGFWEMTHERKGNAISATVIFIAFVFTVVLQKQGMSFLFTDISKEFNLLSALLSAIVPVALWCICNWSVSTLMDGDGKPSQIAMGTVYALVPYIIFNLLSIPLTYVLTSEEAMFVTILGLLAAVWTGFLILVSTITVHDFTLSRAVGTIIITLIGMAIVIFLFLLAFNLVQQMVNFIISIYNQLIIRL